METEGWDDKGVSGLEWSHAPREPVAVQEAAFMGRMALGQPF